MPSYEHRIQIERPATEVFDFVATNGDRNNPLWEEEVESWTDVSPRPIGEGTTAVMHRIEGGKRSAVHLVCTEFQPDGRIAWKHTDPGPFKFAISFTTIPLSPSLTELRVRVDITLSGPLRLMSPLIRRRMASTGLRLTGNVKTLLEATPALTGERSSV